MNTESFTIKFVINVKIPLCYKYLLHDQPMCLYMWRLPSFDQIWTKIENKTDFLETEVQNQRVDSFI
jgi:hypothetical protein